MAGKEAPPLILILVLTLTLEVGGEVASDNEPDADDDEPLCKKGVFATVHSVGALLSEAVISSTDSRPGMSLGEM